MSAPHHHVDNSLAGVIEQSTHVKTARCYQCGKCSAGCPLATEMDYPPSMIVRMLQTGDKKLEEKVLRSKTIWLCLTCEMCISRCPMEVDIPKMMDFLREKSLREKKTHPYAKNIIDFHKSFLSSIKKTGRLYEIGLVVEYKMRSRKLLQDVLLAPKMFAKGKLKILPEMIKNRKQIERIFAKTIEKKEESK
jgi:heterodisulfide reductase subunit C2